MAPGRDARAQAERVRRLRRRGPSKLIADGWTTAGQLAVAGGSNGGLLVGATLTQQPDLCAAAVCSAPLLDMVRYERFGLGETWNDEYGTAADPQELGWLLGYSPYHHVREGTAYPAVLFTVFDGDTRVDPLHARKMCAALQYATTVPLSERPVVLRREGDRRARRRGRSAATWRWRATSWRSAPGTRGWRCSPSFPGLRLPPAHQPRPPMITRSALVMPGLGCD